MVLRHPTHGGNLEWASELAGCLPCDLLDFSASINPLGLPQSAIAAITDTLPTLTAYPDPSYRRLRRAIAQHHDLDPDWILPGNGAAELITWAGRDLAEQDLTLLFAPAFADYGRALQTFAATYQFLPSIVDPQGIQVPASPLRSHIPDAGSSKITSLGLLINNPHNPTGHLFSRADLEAWLGEATIGVIDEAFMDFLPIAQQQSLIDRVEALPQLTVVRSLTKFYALPGLRLGYAIAHPDRLKRWQQWRDPWSVNTLAAAVAEAVLADRDYQQRTYDWLAAAKPQLEKGLERLPGLQVYPSAANFLLVRSNWPVPQIQQALLKEHRILIRDCLSFPELGDRYFRVAIRTTSENQQLLAGLADVLSHLATDRA